MTQLNLIFHQTAVEFCLVLILSGVDAHITIETYESCQPIECRMVKPDLTECECER